MISYHLGNYNNILSIFSLLMIMLINSLACPYPIISTSVHKKFCFVSGMFKYGLVFVEGRVRVCNQLIC